MNKVLTGGIVGGFVVFVWGAISHMVLPLGEAGIQSLPNEDAVLGAMRSSIAEPGLYFFPGLDMHAHPSEAQQKAWEEKHRTGPAGLLVYTPVGGEPIPPRKLITELVSNILGAVIASCLLTKVGGTFWRRAGTVAVLGLFAWISIEISYWNWYGFPGTYVVAQAVDQVVGWGLAGLAIAKLVKPAAA